MKTVKTSGIVLKGINFGEADKILTVFTLDLGKVKVMAKGIRKIKSHLCGSLEPFILADLQLYPGKTFYLATGAAIKKEFFKLHNDLDKAAKAFYLGELVDRFSEEGEENQEVFSLFVKSLEEVEEDLPGPLIQAFELKLIEASGFKPELYFCNSCKEAIKPDCNIWSNEAGGLVCPLCRKNYNGYDISRDAIKFFRFVERANQGELFRIRAMVEVEVEAEKILNSYIESILERELKSKAFLKSIKKKG